MEEKFKSIIESTFARIISIQNHIDNVYAALNSVTSECRSDGNLIESLYAKQNKEWQNLFMFGLVADQDSRDRIKAAAYQRFLNDKMYVKSYMGDNWLMMEEEEFRRMCRELFAPTSAKIKQNEIIKELDINVPSENCEIKNFNGIL